MICGPERLGIEVAKQLDDVGIPGPPQVPRQLRELGLQLLARSHVGADYISPGAGRRETRASDGNLLSRRASLFFPSAFLLFFVPAPRQNVVIVAPEFDGRTTKIRRAGDGGWEGLATVSPHARSRQARGALRWPLPDHRLRSVEPGQLGHPVDLRAHPVQVPVAGRARAADLGGAQHVRFVRDRRAGADADGGVLVPGHRRFGVPEPAPHRGVPRRRGAGVRRRPHLQDEHPPDDRLPLPEVGHRDHRLPADQEVGGEPVRHRAGRRELAGGRFSGEARA